MSLRKKLLRNLVLLFLSALFLLSAAQFHLTPTAAYRAAERGYHYGPGTVLEEFTVDGDVYFYDRYRHLRAISKISRDGLFWRNGGHRYTFDPAESPRFRFCTDVRDNGTRFYFFCRTDPQVAAVTMETDGALVTFTQQSPDSDLFFWFPDPATAPAANDRPHIGTLRTYDRFGRLLHEEKRNY